MLFRRERSPSSHPQDRDYKSSVDGHLYDRPLSGKNRRIDGGSRSSVDGDLYDRVPQSNNERIAPPPPTNRRSSSTPPFLPTRVSKKKETTSVKDLRQLKKTLFGQLSPLDVLENLVKSHNLKGESYELYLRYEHLCHYFP